MLMIWGGMLDTFCRLQGLHILLGVLELLLQILVRRPTEPLLDLLRKECLRRL